MNIIAEVGLHHDGSLGTAHAYIDAIAHAGANTAKFQCHYADATTEFRPGSNPFPQDATRQDFYKRTSFTTQQWADLADHAHDVGLGFCVSVFSKAAIDYLHGVAVGYWKIGSGQVGNLPLVSALTGRWEPLIISSGMSDWKELDLAVSVAIEIEKKNPAQLRPSPLVMHCVSEYPVPASRAGVTGIMEMKRRYPGVPVGLSDHSGTIWPSIVAAAYGADLIEVHVTWSKECFGPDVAASVTIEELKRLVEGVRYVESMGSVDRDKLPSELKEMRKVFCVR